ncbi:MAG: protein translocase subunit SecD [Candidatus Peribacteraceae bacterium]
MASANSRSAFWPTITIIVAVLSLIIVLPDSAKKWAPGFLKPSLRLGLDLAGGTQLDFRISEDEINARELKLAKELSDLKKQDKSKEALAKEFELRNVQQQHTNLVEAIRIVLERRINSLGVSEATITPSYFGNEKHLLVECPGIIDADRCIATVGKTIQLEFKEEFSGSPEEYARKVRDRVDKVYASVTRGTGSLQVIGQDVSNQLGVWYFDTRPIFLSDLPKGLEALMKRTEKDPVLKSETVLQTTAENEQGQTEVQEIKGIYLTKVLGPRMRVTRPLKDPALAYAELAKQLGGTRESKVGSEIKPSQIKRMLPDLGFSVKTSGKTFTVTPPALQAVLQTAPIGAQQVVPLGSGYSGLLYLAGRTEGAETMTASHILIQYKGAFRAENTVIRTKDQALALAQEIRKRLQAGGNFEEIARTESDGPSREKAGSLGVISRGMMVEQFERVSFTLKQGEISAVTETPFGFHIIRADKAAARTGAKVSYELLRLKMDETGAKKLLSSIENGEVSMPDDQILIRGIFFSLQPTGWQDTDLNGRRFRSAAVTTDPVTNIPVVQIQFDEEGGKIFQQLTKRNIGKSIAIFVGGELISAPTVQNEIIGGDAVITGSRSFEEARKLAQDLNTGAIPAPIYLSGQTTVEATLGSSALQQSIVAAAVGLAVLCLFMILIYRLLGVLASLALLFYVLLLMASMKLPILLVSREHVVLTLAGIAGMILSMGMAVDANVLAFERIKEELRRGKLYRTAVDTGFRKAWPSVRDGNTSTLITCAILFTIGTSIIRGFAITLSIGIFISLFTAIVVSRWLCRRLANSPLAERMDLFGVKRSELPPPGPTLTA